MNLTICIFVSPILKYIYYLILYQWQLYIHVRSTIHFFSIFFLSSSSICKCIHYQSEFYTHLVRYDQQYQGPGDYDFCTSEVFHSPLDVRDCFNSRSAQNDSDIVAWWSGNAISTKGRLRCLGTAGPNFLNSKFKNNFSENQHVFTCTTLEWVAHNFFLSNLFECFY